MEPEEPKIDWFIFTTTGIVIAVVTLLLLLAPQASQEAIKDTKAFLTANTGFLYIWFGIGVMFFLRSFDGPSLMDPNGPSATSSRKNITPIPNQM